MPALVKLLWRINGTSQEWDTAVWSYGMSRHEVEVSISSRCAFFRLYVALLFLLFYFFPLEGK